MLGFEWNWDNVNQAENSTSPQDHPNKVSDSERSETAAVGAMDTATSGQIRNVSHAEDLGMKWHRDNFNQAQKSTSPTLLRINLKADRDVSNEEDLGMRWHRDNFNPIKPAQTTLSQSIADLIRPAENIDPAPQQKTEQAEELSEHRRYYKQFLANIAELKEELRKAKTERDQQKKKTSELEATINMLKYNVESENARKMEKLEEGLDSLQLNAADDEEEPGIALEDQLRITEQSAKAIDLLSNHLLSTVWQPCSKNTFGNEEGLTFLFVRFPIYP